MIQLAASLARMDRYGQSYNSDSEEHSPVMWWRGHPVYAAHFIVVVFVISLFVTTALKAFNVAAYFEWLGFDSSLVLRGQVWRVFTYGLVNLPSLNFAFDMLYFAWFGREVERAVGRRTFLWIYATIYLISPVLLTLLGLTGWHSVRMGETGALAIFVAFATFYPGTPIFFSLLAKWAAIILVGIYTLIGLADRDLPSLLTLWGACGFAYGFVRHHQGHFTLPTFKFRQRKPKLRVLPDLPPKAVKTPSATRATETGSPAEIDALLDKIAQSGYASLTPKERAKLESHSQSLKKNSGRG